jgi:hypothetical protein
MAIMAKWSNSETGETLELRTTGTNWFIYTNESGAIQEDYMKNSVVCEHYTIEQDAIERYETLWHRIERQFLIR